MLKLREREKPVSLERPDEDEIQRTMEETRLALNKIVDGKIKAALPKQSAVMERAAPAFLRYTPQNMGGDGPEMPRIIRMVESAKDPLEPPRFRHKRLPRGPPSPPPAILHSPPRAVTAKEQADWKVPPCISNWKNSKGHVIPLDKRLASDGRGLEESVVNDQFAKVSQALMIAEQQAREEVALRAAIQAKITEKEKLQKEEKLRSLAQEAREQKATLGRARDESERDREEARRDKIQDIRRDLRTQHMGKEAKERYLQREASRDISEKIALGLAKPTLSGDMLFDQRLFNQSEVVAPNLHDDESYSVYDKPLFAGQAAGSIYTYRDRDGAAEHAAKSRSGPVEFEKEELDPFGVNQFMNEAKNAKRPSTNDADSDRSSKRGRS